MDDKIKFIDPAFSCEVELSPVCVALYRAADDQFNRLKEIRNLGLIGRFDDIGFHTKHQHAVGLFRIFEKLLQQPTGKGLPKEFLWSFWARICFSQVGHAVFAYDSEKAVLLACHVSTTYKDIFSTFLSPVIQEAKQHLQGDEATNESLISSWLDNMIDSNDWRRVHLWVAALKLVRNNSILSVLSNQKYDKDKGSSGFKLQACLDILLNPKSEWDDICERLNRLDFVVRDLNFTGRLGVSLDVDRLVANPGMKNDPDWDLIQKLADYLKKTLYTAPRHQTETKLFQRTLADLLLKNKVSLDNLFGISGADYLTDDDLEKVIRKKPQGKELFEPSVRSGWETWAIAGDVESEKPPTILEQKLIGRRDSKAILIEPHHTKIIAYQLSKPTQRPGIGIAIRHRDASDRPNARDFLMTCHRAVEALYPWVAISNIHKAIGEGFCGKKINIGFREIFSELGQLPLTNDKPLKELSKYLSKKSTVNITESGISLGFEDFFKPRFDSEIRLRAAHSALTGTEAVRNNLSISYEKAVSIVLSHLLTWQQRYFISPLTKTVVASIHSIQESLKVEIFNGNGTDKGRLLELYAFLEALINPLDRVKVRFCLPNFVILRANGTPENEYDVISFILKTNMSVEILIWGVTTEIDISKKRRDDTTKIQRLKDLLGQRWEGIRTVQNYVHLEAGQICLEIDGCHERR